MLAALFLAIVPPPPIPPLPAGLGEVYLPGPSIVFFTDSRDVLSPEDMAILTDVRRAPGISTAARATVCLPTGDACVRRRRTLIVRAIVRPEMPAPRIAHDGRGCAFADGSRRAPGFVAYQIDIGP